jgi:hypothetical protein
MHCMNRLRSHVSPALFALAALAFVLPFATVSCEGAETSFTALQLATRTVPDGGRPDGGGFGESCTCRDISDEVEHPDSWFADAAAFAALVGLGLGIARMRRGPGWAALVGLLSTAYMGLSGGLATVHLRIGYWLMLGSFGAAAALHLVFWWRRRRAHRSLVGSTPVKSNETRASS